MQFVILLAAIFAGISANSLSIDNNSAANGRIIGSATDLGNTMSTPFIAAVYHGIPGFLCSGIIVNVKWILTTAECVYAYSFENPVQVYAEVGGVKINTVESGKFSLPLARIVIHPEFHSREMIYYNNLALMKTINTIPATAFISPIALPTPTTVTPAGSTGNLVGWGGTGNSFPVTNLQMSPSNVVLAMKECQRLSGMIIEKEFCTDPDQSSSACKYDHGSPLFEFDPVFGSILLGMVNYAPCLSSYPTVYTNIPDYVDWIQNTILAFP